MANFEDRLTALSSPETVKKAKALLKQKQLAGAWRNRHGQLCGIFKENPLPPAEVAVTTGENTSAVCSCGNHGTHLCHHAVAMLMYSGRFRFLDETAETPPVYSKGLVMQNFNELSARGMKNCAKLRLNVVEDQLHAPNQYKVLLLSAKLTGTSREYSGNLSNLRQLYFEKTLSAVMKFDDFSLHDQQIIRFVALNGEADNSNIALGAELAAELFHALPGFPNFFRDGRQIIVRPERATAVLAKAKGQIMPAIRIDQAVLPMTGARVIAGRAGCWVGKHDEYFFIGGDCEAGFLRSFFRTAPRSDRELTAFPLPVMDAGNIDPEIRPCSIMLDGTFDDAGIFTLKTGYLYSAGNRNILFAPRSGRVAAYGKEVFRRDAKAERDFENILALSGLTIDGHTVEATMDDPEKAGIFLDRALSEFSAANPGKLHFSAGFAALINGGNGLSEVPLYCTFAGKNEDAFILDYQLGTPGNIVSWEKLLETALVKNSYLLHRGSLLKISSALGKFMRSSGALIRNLDTAGCRFEVPFGNFRYFCTLAGKIPGALPVELLLDAAGNPPENVLQETFKFDGTLRKYQQQGVSFMQYLTDRNFNPLLADEMGLGKTIQLLALLSSRMSKNGPPSLVVCPASLITNWAREAARFVPGFRVAAPIGNDRETVLKEGNFDLLILSYTAAKLSQAALKKYFFDFLVLDEAQHIKNPGSSNAKNCKSIRASHRIVLTGTPLENSPEDLWSVMDFLQPGLFGSLPSFRRRYANIGSDPELQEEFTGRISPFIKRRTKSEVAADLPQKNERTVFCEMSPAQREFYNKLLEDNREVLRSGGNSELFALLLRLRQCCCNPALIPGEENSVLPSAKTELLMELLHETIDSGHKVLLFSQFTSMLKIFIPLLREAKIPFEYLDGSTKNRQEKVDNFNNDPDIPLFLLSLKAGGTGLNLTSADTVIIYDPWWNPAVELQAADRTHRIGQTRTVSTVKLVMKDSVEEKVLMLQQKKRELFHNLVENPAAAGGISIAELRALME